MPIAAATALILLEAEVLFGLPSSDGALPLD
ncbi:trimethylamine:corrinoid methyltransferase-like protein [Bradyrhizobium sp. LM2.7]